MSSGNLKLTSNIDEQTLVEHLLNSYYSGLSINQVILILSLHALANSWKFNKLDYYMEMFK